MRHIQRTQEQRIQHSKDHGVRANGQRQRQNGGDGESGRLRNSRRLNRRSCIRIVISFASWWQLETTVRDSNCKAKPLDAQLTENNWCLLVPKAKPRGWDGRFRGMASVNERE